jgi:guanosine-3',5'-bis(diphosphate) 3'-pyrophosphohydrolase
MRENAPAPPEPFLLLRAVDFAARKHRDQRRKDHQASPYINHPVSVAVILAETGRVGDPEILAAAVLHDTLEDTDTTPGELESLFGARIRGYVEEVTDDKSLPKAARKRLQVERAAGLSRGAALIKLGDKISNVADVVRNPPAAWDPARRGEYLDWAAAVVEQLPVVSPALEARFAALLLEGRRTLASRRARGDPKPPAPEPSSPEPPA